VRATVAALLAFLLGPVAALAQAYPDIHPIPQTTDAAKLRATAVDREIQERFRIGFQAETRGDWLAAKPEFERILALHPREPLGSSAHYDLALALINLHDLQRAGGEFAAAIRLDPDFLAARANLVTVDLMREDFASARKDADELVARAPASARARYVAGLASIRAGDAAGAVTQFGALLERDPSYAVAHYDLALAEIDLGRFDDAERELRSALNLSPRYARASLALGTVLLRTGKRDQARAAFEECIRASSDPSLTNLATSLRDAVSQTQH
jgi:tetratricopeptide (TPR) repeat protein